MATNKRNHLGIDHPLVAIADMDKAAVDFARLGFFYQPKAPSFLRYR